MREEVRANRIAVGDYDYADPDSAEWGGEMYRSSEGPRTHGPGTRELFEHVRACSSRVEGLAGPTATVLLWLIAELQVASLFLHSSHMPWDEGAAYTALIVVGTVRSVV